MTERSGTVLVTGLPRDVQRDRLEDKLCIHFQRGCNGGGEVVSVRTVQTSADLALVTFEDSGVAQRVIQKQHVLEVDDKRFSLTVKKLPPSTSPEKVILNLSATVDYSQLRAGRKSVSALSATHPDVQISYNPELRLCHLSGSYSSVQAALAQLLGQSEHPQTPQNKDLKTSIDSHSSPLPLAQVSHDQSRPQKDKKEKPLVEKHTSGSQRDVTPGGYEWQDQGASASAPGFDEDFSLIVDADMFRYLQKYCGEEYHQILRRHGVAAVDYTHQGLTTLLLQVATGDGQREQERLRKAKEEISGLYEANQADVCRDKILKAILPERATLKRAIGKLSGKVIVSEDEQSVYLIGSKEVIEEARKFLLLHDHNREEQDVTSSRRFQDTNEVTPPGVSDSNGLDQVEEDSRPEGSPKVKLAAQFHKDSRLAPIGSKTSDFSLRGHTQSRNRTRQGPMLGYDVLSDARGSARTNERSTSGEHLLENTDATMDTRPKSIHANSIWADGLATTSPPNASGSNLRRSSSFSGVVPRKEPDLSAKSDTEKRRGRSSSLSRKEEQHSAQIIVENLMWFHIIKAYKPRLVELTSEIQMKEKRLENGKDVAIILTGKDSSKVAACHRDLQRLINSVSVDFTFKSLPLADIGLTDAANETLQACFAEIHSRYKKISIEVIDKSLYFFGPELLCSQVLELLREVFVGAQLSPRNQDHSRSLTSGIGGLNGQDSSRKDAVLKEKVKANLERKESVKNDGVNGEAASKTKRQQQNTAAAGGAGCGACGRAGAALRKTACGANVCPDCLSVHGQCRVCESREKPKAVGIQGKMSYASLPMSIPGFNRDPAIKITYTVPDGVQGEKDPSPGRPFQGGQFEAYLPDCEPTRALLPRLQEALRRGHTFAVNQAGRVDWGIIPHKTNLQGGKSSSGYPDVTYLNRLADILASLGI